MNLSALITTSLYVHQRLSYFTLVFSLTTTELGTTELSTTELSTTELSTTELNTTELTTTELTTTELTTTTHCNKTSQLWAHTNLKTFEIHLSI